MAFWQSGIIPYNLACVINKLREAEPIRPVTPPSHSYLLPFTTPLTLCTLKRRAEELQDSLSSSPGYQKKWNTFIKESIAQVTSSAIAYEHLEHTRAAEQARA